MGIVLLFYLFYQTSTPKMSREISYVLIKSYIIKTHVTIMLLSIIEIVFHKKEI